jgi:flagellar basal-body rod protein FlgB
MYGKLEIFRMAQGLAMNASARQSVISSNVANADTPGYRAKDIAPFSETYRSESSSMALRTTRPGHVSQVSEGESREMLVDAPGPSDPNGNTVSLETEVVKAAEVRQQYDLAISVYKSSLGILRSSLGR